MASSPKITVTIPTSLKIPPEERAALKRAFNAAAVSVFKKFGKVAGADITNWGGSARGGSKARKKYSKKTAAKKKK
jgi:hypothetical protein